MAPIKDLIYAEKTAGDLYILFPEEYRNNVWAKQYGQIQDILLYSSSAISTVELDMSNCTWIDPLPLLSLLLSIAEAKAVFRLIIPDIGSNAGASNKVLALLQTEGFLEQFVALGVKVCYEDRVPLNRAYFLKYESLTSMLNYANCTIVKAQVQDLDKVASDGSVDEWVKRLIEEKKYDIRNKVDSLSAEEVITRLRSLLSETIGNVYEHAYGENRIRNVAFYIRFREGLGNNKVNASDREKLKRLFTEEHNNSPELDRFFIDSIFSFIEIFVIDSGIGLSKSYGNDLEKKYPFRQAFQRALIDGKRGPSSKNKKTEFGGLYSIGRHLGNNYLCGRDENEWVGTSLPCRNEVLIGKEIESVKQIDGLALIYRLTWDVVADDATGWNRLTSAEYPIFIRELANDKDIYSRFYGKKLNEFFKEKNVPFYVRDNRFSQGTSILDNQDVLNNRSTEFCMYLPEIGLQKNRIFENVNSMGKILNKSRTLIIADILTQEAHLFQLAIENAFFSSAFCANFDFIVLVTQRLSVLVLKKTAVRSKLGFEQKFVFESAEVAVQRNFISKDPMDSEKFAPYACLKHLFAWLKTYDSLLFWMNIKNKNLQNNDLYVNNNIRWYDDDSEIQMHGYLNFAQTLTENLSQKIYENSLIRTLCLSKGNGCFYENIDVLTDRLASKMNSLFYNERVIDPDQKILLGSVVVSGMSQKSAEKVQEKDSIIIHFFKHGGTNISEQEDKFHLLLWPSSWLKDIFAETFDDYRRVGRSHVIAPYGWKYYPIPRYRLFNKTKNRYENDYTNLEPNDEFEFICAYECSPSETYNEIQIAGKQNIEIGHFHYENKHDIFKIDFPMLVSNSFNENGKLCQFLLSEFLMALGTDASGIIEEVPDSLRQAEKNRTSKTSDILSGSIKNLKRAVQARIAENSTDADECAVIVYPYHYVTEHIVELIKSYLSVDLHDRIIALIPITKERSGTSFLISPLTFETIRQKIKQFKLLGKKPYVLLFDEVVISGRTRKELKHLLFHLGAEEIKTLCIVDRRRLPFSTTDPARHKAYWRLDIPRLGNMGNCLICKSLEKVSSLRNNLICEEERLLEWEKAWSSTFPYSKMKEHGLSAKSLKKTIRKKFSLYINRETGESMHHDTIDLVNSLGVSIYACEIHSMTSRDDIALDLSNDSNLDSLSVIELLCVNLLLYGKEFSGLIIDKAVKRLFQEVNKTSELTNETALAAITLLAQNPVHIEALYDECKKANERDLTLDNYDLELLFAYFAQNENSKFATSNKISGHLKSNAHNAIRINKLLHSEIYNEHGKIHNTPLQNIVVLNEDSVYNRNLFITGKNSCEKILFLLNKFPIWNAFSFEIENNTIDNLVRSIRQSVNRLKTEIEGLVDQKEKSGSQFLDKGIYPILQILKVTFGDLKVFHSYFFANETQLYNKLQCIVDEFVSRKTKENKAYRIYLDRVGGNSIELVKWVNWDLPIVNKINFVLDNCRHAKGEKMKFSSAEQEYDMTLSLRYCRDSLQLVFSNHCDSDIDTIREATGKKNKPEKQHIKELGGKVDYKKEGSVLETIIELKYI